jgi:3-deoxy-D-manno-octulosonic-acid transferase
MDLSVGLALYRLTAPRPARRGLPRPDRPARAPGRMVWLHAPTDESRASLLELARRLIEEDGLPILLTVGDAGAEPPALPADMQTDAPPDDTGEEVRAFLDHWRPDIVVMAEGELRPLLLEELVRRQIPRMLVDGIAPRLVAGRRGWFPGLTRRALSAFPLIRVRDDAAAAAFRKAGADPGRLRVSGPMEEASAALPCAERDRAALALALATRPVWLAADLPEGEEPMIIAAHREALKLAHRLLLILAPADPSRRAALAAALEAGEGWNVTCRMTDEEPDRESEVCLVEGGAELGLWYRLAPVTYLGGGMSEGGCRRDPMEAAALGSALILGPRAGAWGRAYGRLAQGRAARLIASAPDLNLALSDLLSPDRAARQAQAAWALASDGAEVTDEVIAALRAAMDGEEPPAPAPATATPRAA